MATLYRKYRSKTFGDVIGQEPIVTTLTNQIRLGRVGHAYLFTGSRGIGKTSCARIFARAVNCLHPVNGSPCGECEVCKKLESPDNVDIIEMDAASNNGVDDARDIREKVKYLPVAGKYKVYIIDEVHMLTGGAFNALLKTIEEPPEHVIFILATTEPQKLPSTILSRCIRFDFKLVPTDVLAAHISRVYDAEGIAYEKEAAAAIARLGEGSVRDALSIADMLSSAADVITPEIVLKLTGAGDSEMISELFDHIAARELAGCMDSVDRLSRSGKSMAAVCRQLNAYARNVIVIKSVGRAKSEAGGLINLDSAAIDRLAVSADKAQLADIARILDIFGAAESGLRYSVNPRLYLETAIVKAVCGADEADDLRKRITALERKVADPAAQKKNNYAVEQQPPAEAARQQTQNDVKPGAPSASADFDEPEPPPVSAYEPPPARAQQQAQAPTVQTPPVHTPTPTRQSPAPPPVQKPTVKQTERAVRDMSGGEIEPKTADEGEFMQSKAKTISGLELLGKVATYLRKSGAPLHTRVRELLSRGVVVKERADVIAFIVPDENYLLVSEEHSVAVLDEALAASGIHKRASVEKSEDDLYADDLARARELFGKECVIVDSKKN